ncbi:MAG: glycosyltransferase family 4 protein [Ardenticatenales bacterium]|nr:glycosyltransferase family 4 protein [Ardenticatenales bacterium]
MRLSIIFTEYLHYHVARCQALWQTATSQGHQVHLWSLRAAAPELPASGYHEQLRDKVKLIAPSASLQPNSHEAARMTYRCADEVRPDAILIPGYATRYARALLRWCHHHGAGAVLMSESRAADFARQRWRESLKGVLVRQFDAALVGGQPHQRYLEGLGMPAQAIFDRYDVVDNAYWSTQTDRARQEAATWRARLGLTTPYFMTANRFVEKKNLRRLVGAYARYRAAVAQPWSLVLAGSGPLEAEIRQAVAAHGLEDSVLLPGYLPTEQLVPYFALAEAFIHPSHHAEQWGLVVNEAMAAALPVLVSKTVGCVEDLLLPQVTGFTFDPFSEAAMADAMMLLSALSAAERARMGRRGREHISAFSPQTFAENALAAAEMARARQANRGRPAAWPSLLWW